MIKPVFLYLEDSSEKILKKLKQEHINACIVVTKEKQFLGTISDNDIINLFLQQVKYEPIVELLNRGYRREFIYKKAKDIIDKRDVTVRVETALNLLLEKIWKENCQYIPVIDKKEKVVGVVTPSSIINLLKDY